jgi:ABC-type multidrug transport system fused ATPase/permease subunit
MHIPLHPVLRNLAKTSQFWQDNRLILKELRHFPRVVVLVFLFPFLAAAFEGFGIGFLLVFLQNLVSPATQPLQTGIQWLDIWVLGILSSTLERLYRVSGLILLSIWLRASCDYFAEIYTQKARLHLTDRMYCRIFDQLQSLNLNFFSQVRSGDIINTLTSEVAELQEAIDLFGFLLMQGLMLLMYGTIALTLSWQLSVLAIFLFTLVALGVSQINHSIGKASFPVSEARSEFSKIAMEFINGIRTVQLYNTQEFERRRYLLAASDIFRASLNLVYRKATVSPLANALASTALIAIIIIGMTAFVMTGKLQIAALLTFLFVLFRMTPLIPQVVGGLAYLKSFQGSIQKIETLLRMDDKPYLINGYRPFNGLQRGIDIVGVEFGYDPATPVLQDITLTIEKGQTVALVGASGAGKSTLADLIPRLYDPIQGQILLDGTDLRSFDVYSVRCRMAMVSQDTFIFNASVWDNIAYGSPEADKTAILEAAQMANALEFIQKLPERFETVLGDRGVRLSGGQRQRIAIARALLRNPEILILDEATSALDSVSEQLIQESLEKLSFGKTVIAIAHRLSTIAKADKVVVLEQGHIVEQGTYQELLALRGTLWKYHQMQNSAVRPSSP